MPLQRGDRRACRPHFPAALWPSDEHITGSYGADDSSARLRKSAHDTVRHTRFQVCGRADINAETTASTGSSGDLASISWAISPVS